MWELDYTGTMVWRGVVVASIGIQIGYRYRGIRIGTGMEQSIT